MRILDIIDGTSVDGPGLRTTIYFAGCHHRCPGCHNPQSWDPLGGREWTLAEILDVVDEADFPVTFSGGDPLYQPIGELVELARAIHARGKDIWCYTGFTIEEISNDSVRSPILREVDVLVDGPYVQGLRDLSLHFRGSSNQRIINLRDP